MHRIWRDPGPAVKHLSLIGVHAATYGAVWALSSTGVTLWTVVLALLFMWISCSDVIRFEIPDTGALALAVTGIFAASNLQVAAIGAVLWASLFWLTAVVSARIMGRDALGFGDVKLIAGIGAWLGPIWPIYVVLAATLSALVILLAHAALYRSSAAGTGIAFAPFLCLCAWAIWLWGGGA